MNILAIDPGPSKSAWVLVNELGAVMDYGWRENPHVLGVVMEYATWHETRCAVEMIEARGMPVGAETFETCVWIGRYCEAWESRGGSPPAELVYRRTVKMHLCGTPAAKDANIRQALIDRYGPGKAEAIGTKKKPGPLFGIAGDAWAALAVAVTVRDQQEQRESLYRV